MNEQLQQQGFYHIKHAFQAKAVTALITATKRLLNNAEYKEDLLSIGASGHTHKILYPLGKDKLFLKMLVYPNILKILLESIENRLEIVPT